STDPAEAHAPEHRRPGSAQTPPTRHSAAAPLAVVRRRFQRCAWCSQLRKELVKQSSALCVELSFVLIRALGAMRGRDFISDHVQYFITSPARHLYSKSGR